MVLLNSIFKNIKYVYSYFSDLMCISQGILNFQRFFTHFDFCRLQRHLWTKIQKPVGQIGVLFSGESKSAIKNGGSHLSFLFSLTLTASGRRWGVEFGIIECPPTRRTTFITHFFDPMHSSRDISMSSDKSSTLYDAVSTRKTVTSSNAQLWRHHRKWKP